MLYKNIKNKLKECRVFFTSRGEERHSDDLDIKLPRNLRIEPYTGFLRGNFLWSMGSFSYSHSNLPITTEVGRYCSISSGVSVLGFRHPLEWLTTSSSSYDHRFSIFNAFLIDNHIPTEHTQFRSLPKPNRKHGLIVEHDVWIGANCVLKNNLVIGTGSVIAANSVVVKDVPPYAIVGGNPAKIIRYRFSPQQIEKLLALEWWKYNFVDLQNLSIENIDEFIKEFEEQHKNWIIFKPEPITFNDLV